MDQAKTCAALLTNGKTCNYWDGIPLNRPMMPTICIPTTSGTGSEVTFVAVITDPVREYKMSIGDPKHLLPTCAICDPLVTLGLPQTLTASCGIDALTHAIEAFTSKASSAATDALALRAITLIARNINRAWEHPDDISARDAMMTGSTLAGSAFINSNVGAVHALAAAECVFYSANTAFHRSGSFPAFRGRSAPAFFPVRKAACFLPVWRPPCCRAG